VVYCKGFTVLSANLSFIICNLPQWVLLSIAIHSLICIVCRAAEDVFKVSVEDILAGFRNRISREKVEFRNSISAETTHGKELVTAYSAECEMSVKFTDDIGVSEGPWTKVVHDVNFCSWLSSTCQQIVHFSVALNQPSILIHCIQVKTARYALPREQSEKTGTACCKRLATRNHFYVHLGTQSIWTTLNFFCRKFLGSPEPT